MKLRLMIGWCALAATVALGEDVTGKNVCGLMNVPSKAEVTMIAVPWVTVGGADTMKVANLVKTDTLSPGDELYYYDGGVYRCKLWFDTDSKKLVLRGELFVFGANEYLVPFEQSKLPFKLDIAKLSPNPPRL